MKKIWVLILLVAGGWAIPTGLFAQEPPAKIPLTRAEKSVLKQKAAAEQEFQINKLINSSEFVLMPNTVSGQNVNPALNFILLTGDTLVFQTSYPFDRAKSTNYLTDKTVMGRVTGKSLRVDGKTRYASLQINMMTEVGIGFHIGMRISPTGNATAWISPNNMAGRIDYQGHIVAWEDADISIGPESWDLANFPWLVNPLMANWKDR